jgi:SPRY domain
LQGSNLDIIDHKTPFLPAGSINMHESTADTICTNGDYSVFVNHPKEFFLKLTLHEESESMKSKVGNTRCDALQGMRLPNLVSSLTWPIDSSQVRIVELSSIYDEERSKASYGKLVDRVVSAVGYEINTAALKLTYQDFEDDAVVVSSTQELTHAIRQFYNKGMMKFVGSAQRETEFNSNKNTLPPVVVSALPSSPSDSVATEGPGIAKDLVVHFPTARFDPSRAASGLALDENNRRVTNTTSDNARAWKCIYVTDGITSGCKYWSFKIINRATGHITIGISDSTFDVSGHRAFPGYRGAVGCSLGLCNVYIHHRNTSSKTGDAFRVKNATVVGVLVDMNCKTVSFYADGEPVGTVGADASGLTSGKEYFPVLSLLADGQCVEVMDTVPPPLHMQK